MMPAQRPSAERNEFPVLSPQIWPYAVGMKHAPITCESCGESLTTIDYKVWGTKRFNPTTGNYDEDDTMGNADVEFLARIARSSQNPWKRCSEARLNPQTWGSMSC